MSELVKNLKTVSQSKSVPISAGLAIFYKDTILLGHPTGANWHYDTYSIPKGLVSNGDDDLISVAIRETKEEIGIEIPRNLINLRENIIEYRHRNTNKLYKKLVWFEVRVAEKLGPFEFKPNDEGIVEIDWAGHMTRAEADRRIHWRQKPILDFIKS